ncbi:MAG: hypothetical protein ACR2NP_08635, partial [Pirellulaceae bacterium]
MKRIRSGFPFGCAALLLTFPLLLTGCTSLTNGGSGWSLANLLSSPAGNANSAEDEHDIFGEADPNRLMWSD